MDTGINPGTNSSCYGTAVFGEVEQIQIASDTNLMPGMFPQLFQTRFGFRGGGILSENLTVGLLRFSGAAQVLEGPSPIELAIVSCRVSAACLFQHRKGFPVSPLPI